MGVSRSMVEWGFKARTLGVPRRGSLKEGGINRSTEKINRDNPRPPGGVPMKITSHLDLTLAGYIGKTWQGKTITLGGMESLSAKSDYVGKKLRRGSGEKECPQVIGGGGHPHMGNRRNRQQQKKIEKRGVMEKKTVKVAGGQTNSRVIFTQQLQGGDKIKKTLGEGGLVLQCEKGDEACSKGVAGKALPVEKKGGLEESSSKKKFNG